MVNRIQDLTIELLQKCHQNCRYCSSDSSSDQNIQLDFGKVIEVIDDFANLGGKVIELSGGEPLSYEFISNIINYIKEKKIEIHLFTCCYVPNYNIDFNLLKKVDKVFVNLQAPNKEIHDYLTDNPGSFDNVINFIKKGKKNKIWIGTHIIPLPYNIDEIDEYVKLAKELKIDNVSLLRYVEQGRGKKNNLQLNTDEILQLHKIISKYYQKMEDSNLQFKYGCPLDFQFIYQRKKSAKPCISGISRCVIRPNGNVIPCPAFKDYSEYIAGNINTETFQNIWLESKIFKTIRKFSYTELEGFCKKCSFLKICQGRCHAQRISNFGNIFSSPDPYCPLYLTSQSK